jgi:protein O-mannosyl-transferase
LNRLRRLPAFWACAAAVLTFLAFSPVLRNGFVDFDDPENFLTNLSYRGLGLSELKWMWTTFHMGPYMPLTWMSHGLDYLLWGLDPFGVHLASLLIHAANAALFFLLALRLLGRAFPEKEKADLLLPAAVAALFFSVHPLRVESVAWATERRDVLAGFFLLLTALSYLRMADAGESGRRRRLAATVALYALSLLSKASGMTLPAVLLVLDVFVLRRTGAGRTRAVLWEKVPFLLAALAAAVLAVHGQEAAGATSPASLYGPSARAAFIGYGVVFYLLKTLLPFGLSPVYTIPQAVRLTEWPFSFCLALAVALTALLFLLRRRSPGLWAAWLAYGLLLAPVSGIFQSGPQIAADRISYFCCLGWALFPGAAALRFGRAGVAASAAVLLALGTLTWRQTGVWKDSETLWSHALKLDPGHYIAHNNLGLRRAADGDLAGAIGHYVQALQTRPGFVLAMNNLGLAYEAQGDLEKAERCYRNALDSHPRFDPAWINMGNVSLRKGDLASAAEHYGKALDLSPDQPDALNGLGVVALGRRSPGEAAAYFERSLRARPDFAPALNNLGLALARQGRHGEAVRRFEEALRIDPGHAKARKNLEESRTRSLDDH